MITNEEILAAKVLIVEDNPANVKLLEMALAQTGHTSVYSTLRSSEAEHLYRTLRPDIVLLDLNMPAPDGFHVLEQIKAIEKDFYAPVLIITANSDHASRLKALHAGAKDFISKPFDITEVLLRIRNLLEVRLLNNRVLQHNSLLEKRVTERTHDLETMNKKLGQEIEQRKNAEISLQHHTEDLERTNTELNDFIQIASHDLQEPVRRTITFCDLLAKQFPEMEKSSENILSRLQYSSLKLRDLIEALSQFSTVVQNGIQPREVSLTAIAQEAVSKIETDLKLPGDHIQVNELPSLEADASQMLLLFTNLIENALKFRKPGDPSIVTLSSLADENGSWKISVADNGVGIEEKHYERIFKPFERLHGNNGLTGTGMGLTLCMKIVRQHGGNISVNSVPGEGTTLNIYLPESHPRT